MSFVCFVELNSPYFAPLLLRDNGLTPIAADAPPIYRVYGPEGLLSGMTGSCYDMETGGISGATNASPVVYTASNHNLTTGMVVTVAGATGNMGANATGVVTVLTANTFSLANTAGNGTYTGGGTWKTTGLYGYNFVAAASNGFESGTSYMVLLEGTCSGVPFGYTQTFTVT